MMFKLPNPFPDRLSQLLRQAVDDARILLDDEHYKLNMSVWVKRGDPCEVCLAGAWLIRHQDGSTFLPLDNGLTGRRMYRVVKSIDDARQGYIHDAVRSFMLRDTGYPIPKGELIELHEGLKRSGLPVLLDPLRPDIPKDSSKKEWLEYLGGTYDIADMLQEHGY